MEIDHLVIASADVASTVRRYADDFGLIATAGGRHEHWGTFNEIVPLAGAYLEIVGVFDPELAATTPFGRWTLDAGRDGDAMAALALRTTDLGAVCARLGVAATPGERRTPDGRLLRWRSAGMAEAMTGGVPFFIEWAAGTPHPGGGDSDGALLRVELSGPPDRLDDWIGGPVDRLHIVAGAPGPEGRCRVAGVELRTPAGLIVALA